MSGIRQLRAVLRKNFLLKKRRPVATLLEAIFPCALFGSAAWMFSLRSSYGSGNCFYPSLPLFPIDALPLIGTPLASQAECEVTTPRSGMPNTCAPVPVDYREDLLELLDKGILCNRKGMDDALSSFLGETGIGQQLTSWLWGFLEEDPQTSHDWLNASLYNITEFATEVLKLTGQIPKYQAEYFNSTWPADVLSLGGELQRELRRIQSWWRLRVETPGANLPAELLSGSWLVMAHKEPWNRTAIGTFLVDSVQWLENTFDIKVKDFVSGVFGWVTTGWLNFMLKPVGKSRVRKVLNKVHDQIRIATGLLRNITISLQSADVEDPVKIAQKVDEFVWFLTHFLKGRGDAAVFLNRLADLADFDVDGVFDHIMGKVTSSTVDASSTLEDEPKGTVAYLVQRIVRRTHSQAPEILQVLDAFDKKVEEIKPDLVAALAHILTKDFFKGLEAAEAGDIQMLASDYLPWVEQGWKSKCPFRRDWLHPDKLVEIFDWMQDIDMYKAFTGTYELNITDFLEEAHAWLQDLDLEWIASAANTSREWVNKNFPSWREGAVSFASQVQMNARQWWWWSPEQSPGLLNRTLLTPQLRSSSRPMGFRWVVLTSDGVPVYTSRDFASRSKTIKKHGDVVIGREEYGWVALNGEPGFLPRGHLSRRGHVGLPEGLATAVRLEYFRRRGTHMPTCSEDESPLSDLLVNRHVLIAPFKGESQHLVKLVAVELSYSLLTGRSTAQDFLTDISQWPPVRAALGLGAYELINSLTKPFPDQKSLNDYAAKHPDRVLAGIVFRTSDRSGNFPAGPLNVGYELRLHAQLVPQTSRVSRQRQHGKEGNSCKPSYPYYERGFTFLQELMGRAAGRLEALRHTGSAEDSSFYQDALRNVEAGELVAPVYNLDLRLEQIPHPASPVNPGVMTFQEISPCFFVACLIPAMAVHVKDAVFEKQEKLRELTRTMGLKTWVYWFGQPIFGVLQMLVMMPLVLVSFYRFIPRSDVSLICVLFLLYGLSIIAFASFVSSFFWRAKPAAAVGGVLHFASFLIYGVFIASERAAGIGLKLFLCIVPNCAGSVGLLTMARWERSLNGAQWSNVHQTPRFTHAGRHVPGLSLLQVFSVLMWDIFLYFVLAWYVDKVSPGTFGIPRPWYFPCLPSFWCGTRRRASVVEAEEISPMRHCDGATEFKQDDLSALQVSVQICGVSKVYPNGKRAVDQLSFEMHQNTIVGLLGPNGAGKSTTMAMMTGLYAPTSGDVLIHGISIRRHPEHVRRLLGICLQHCALYDTLTAREHLSFFAVMKGLSYRADRQEVENMLRSAQLITRQDVQAGHLSAGMRRCLSIGCALIGGSRVLVLDEPTAGIDAVARREIWKLLLISKHSRTMLLSTHAMEEAEALCDQVAVIKEGKLASFGSCMALKQNFGSKYTLQVKTTTEAREEDVTKILTAIVPSITYQGSCDTQQLCYSLAVDERKHFPELLNALHRDKYQSAAGITSFAIQDSTLEVVFPEAIALRKQSFCEEPATKIQPSSPKDFQRDLAPLGVPEYSEKSSNPRKPMCDGMQLGAKQCRSICWMRLLAVRRSKRVFFSTFVLPILLGTIHVTTIAFASGGSDEPSLKMHVRMFDRLLNPDGGRNRKVFIPCSVELKNASLGFRICNAMRDTIGGDADVRTMRWQEESSTLGRYQMANPGDFVDASIGGVSATESKEAEATVTLWFGKRGYHSMPIMMNLWNNARFHLLGWKDTKVEIWNHPLPNTETLMSEEPNPNNEVMFCTMLMITFLLVNVFCLSGVIVSTVHDRVIGSKHQQLVTGVGPVTYWVSNFIIDIGLLLIPTALNVLHGIASGLGAFGGLNVPCLVTLYVSYWLAMTPQMYVVGNFFSNAATAHVCAVCGNIFLAVITVTTIIIWTLYSHSVENDFNAEEELINQATKVMADVFMVLVPSYCVGRALTDVIMNHYRNQLYLKFGICLSKRVGCVMNPLHRDVVGKYLLCLLGNAVFWFSVVLLIESWNDLRCKANSSLCKLLKCWSGKPECGDAEERKRFQESAGVVFDGVHKVFTNGCRQKPCEALAGLKASVVAGECFGIVGTNGAGKTTTMKLVTGSIQPSHGDVWVEGMSVSRQCAAVRCNLGFCPQYDALPEMLTTGETLHFYMGLRGLPDNVQQQLHREVLRKMGLEAFEHTTTQKLSGGNRRKLSTAIALLGWPAVVLLDEPTAGIDVHARRMLWRVVQGAKEQNCAVLLTSHSMEECEALCNRVSVMLSGTLSSSRSPAQLKCETGESYTLTIKAKAVKPGNGETLCNDAASAYARSLTAISDFVTALLPKATMSQDIWGAVCCRFEPGEPSDAARWSTSKSLAVVFQAMEEAVAPGGALHAVAVDFSISQVSVEDVLLDALSRAQMQQPPDSPSSALGQASAAFVSQEAQPEVIGAALESGYGPSCTRLEDITGTRPQERLGAMFDGLEESFVDADADATTLEGEEAVTTATPETRAFPRGLCSACNANNLQKVTL